MLQAEDRASRPDNTGGVTEFQKQKNNVSAKQGAVGA
jgi:hypothetical protein